MDKKTYELIKKKHGGYASWAIWAIPEVWEGAGSRANMNEIIDVFVHVQLLGNARGRPARLQGVEKSD